MNSLWVSNDNRVAALETNIHFIEQKPSIVYAFLIMLRQNERLFCSFVVGFSADIDTIVSIFGANCFLAFYPGTFDQLDTREQTIFRTERAEQTSELSLFYHWRIDDTTVDIYKNYENTLVAMSETKNPIRNISWENTNHTNTDCIRVRLTARVIVVPAHIRAHRTRSIPKIYNAPIFGSPEQTGADFGCDSARHIPQLCGTRRRLPKYRKARTGIPANDPNASSEYITIVCICVWRT